MHPPDRPAPYDRKDPLAYEDRAVNIGAYLLTVKSLDELVEVPPSIVGSGRGLRMVLNSEYR